LDVLTKDQRTVFVGQLTSKATEQNVREYFERMGRVKDIIMLRDKHTGKHKGFAYVEMADLEDIPSVLEVNECIPDFQNFAILVRPSEAEKNYAAANPGISTGFSAAAGGGGAGAAVGKDPSKVFIGNIHPVIDHESLYNILVFYGPVESVKLIQAEPGKSASFAFVHFQTPSGAKAAIASLNGFNIGERRIVLEVQK